jgi:hypothetical protein
MLRLLVLLEQCSIHVNEWIVEGTVWWNVVVKMANKPTRHPQLMPPIRSEHDGEGIILIAPADELLVQPAHALE